MIDTGDRPAISARALKIFALAAILWAAVGVLVCRLASSPALAVRGNMTWFFGLWGLSLFNLLALAMTVREILSFVAERHAGQNAAENRAEIPFIRIIRAFSWGTVKLVCVGIFVLVLLHGRDAWLMGRLLGAGTLIVVPLVGGLGAVGYA